MVSRLDETRGEEKMRLTKNPIWLLASSIILILTFQVRLGLTSHTQLREAHLKLSRLQSLLQQTTEDVETRRLHLAVCDNKIADMDHHILLLNSSKEDTDRKINALEEEVRVLWASLRKGNFDLYLLESMKREAEERLSILESRVNKMAEIVTEQWIQIQQFEQALQLRQMRVLKAKKLVPTPVSALLKLTNELSRWYHPKLERFYSSAKMFHHELQGRIRKEMERHELTAKLANEEFVFLVVSAIIVFPALGAWMLISSQLT